MGKTYLIDTNIILEFAGALLPPDANKFIEDIIANREFNISIINKIEVLGHPSATKALIDFLSLSNIFELDQKVVEQTIELRKINNIKLPDAIIAATAIVYNFMLVSRNTKDFKNIAHLEVINPHVM